jgi:hypothetical protein
MRDFNLIAEALDTVASLTGKWGRWLNIQKSRNCFIVWGLVTMYWLVRDIHIGLYSQAAFCLISIGFHVYGYLKWSKK